MKIWAHRGCSYKYPENTLSSFRAACEYQITGIELDIQQSKDGVLVVIHDEMVDRTTNGTGKVADLTLKELKDLRITANPNTGLDYETIPTMREVFELLAPECFAWGLLINIELKNSVIRYEGMEEQILAMVEEFGLGDFVVYSSFNPDSLKQLKERKAHVSTGILASSLKTCLEISREIKADALHPYLNQMDVDNISELTDLPIRAWNIMEFEPFFPETREIAVLNVAELETMGITDIFTNVPDYYVQKRLEDNGSKIELDKNKRINQQSGYAEDSDEGTCASVHFYKAEKGNSIKWKNRGYCYQIYIYSMETEDSLIYSYCYQQEENWSTYRADLSMLEWGQEDWQFTQECYFRICIKRADGRKIEDSVPGNDIMELWQAPALPYVSPDYFLAEAELTVKEVEQRRRDLDLVFVLLTDSHYVVNGTWEDTASNIRHVSEQIHPDAVIHMGDFTDGMVPIKITKEYTEKVMTDLKETGVPVYLCLGNHDSNYFHNNPEKMTEEEMSRYYLQKDKPYYYVDYPAQKIRVLFLYSFDYRETVRYGYPAEELGWVKDTLDETGDGWSVLVFSHVPPLPVIHFWSDEIRNGEELIQILEAYHSRNGHKVLALIHGHNHAEQVYTKRLFPIVSIGCNKLEDFKDKKPEGSHTFDRKKNTVTQDLWDVMIVSGKKDKIDFIRYGAGEDRTVEC